jgi:hypothetical protein
MSEDNKPDPKKWEIYEDLAQRIQAGVATEYKYEPDRFSPKHLGVGNNLRAVDQGALVSLLVSKGVITWTEYQDALIESAKEEVLRIEAVLSKKMGAAVRLGTPEEAQRNLKEIEYAILSTGETVPAMDLICPVCKTFDINTRYNQPTEEYECPKNHKWPRPKHSTRLQ